MQSSSPWVILSFSPSISVAIKQRKCGRLGKSRKWPAPQENQSTGPWNSSRPIAKCLALYSLAPGGHRILRLGRQIRHSQNPLTSKLSTQHSSFFWTPSLSISSFPSTGQCTRKHLRPPPRKEPRKRNCMKCRPMGTFQENGVCSCPHWGQICSQVQQHTGNCHAGECSDGSLDKWSCKPCWPVCIHKSSIFGFLPGIKANTEKKKPLSGATRQEKNLSKLCQIQKQVPFISQRGRDVWWNWPRLFHDKQLKKHGVGSYYPCLYTPCCWRRKGRALSGTKISEVYAAFPWFLLLSSLSPWLLILSPQSSSNALVLL